MNKLKKEVFWFFIAGISAVTTDFGTYLLLLHVMTHSPAKATSFLTGAMVAYVMNKFLTFEQLRKSYAEMIRFSLLYLVTLGANVAVNKLSLILLPDSVVLAFLAATGTSTILNFLGQKFLVFSHVRKN